MLNPEDLILNSCNFICAGGKTEDEHDSENAAM